MRTPLAAAAYTGTLTWDDAGWRRCPVCDSEWVGEGPCCLDPSHPGHPGRLRSWCRHGFGLVPRDGTPLRDDCERHATTDLSPEFVEWLALAADRALASLET
jgi:hypothetical protein